MTNGLATKAAEVDLQRRVESLQEQLRSATQALESLRSSGEASGRNGHPRGGELSVRPIRARAIAPPPGKIGYLFKWLDRSIGVRVFALFFSFHSVSA